MADNTEKLIKAGEYIIDTAEILSYRISDGCPGQGLQQFRMDIKGIIGKLEFDQNLFKGSMYGKIQVLDQNDVRTLFKNSKPVFSR